MAVSDLTRDAILLAQQAPTGIPHSSRVDTTIDPLVPSQRTADMLAHFFERLYDKRPESHLSRLLKVLLGDVGAGMLRKRYTYVHLSSVLATTHFTDLDRLYAAVFGFRRLVDERLDLDPYTDAADEEEWQEILNKDAAFRARIELFSRAIAWGGTAAGMAAVAQAVLGIECEIIENYLLIDEDITYDDGTTTGVRTYGDLEEHNHGQVQNLTYGEVEGRTVGRTPVGTRNEFVIRPTRDISAEEHYELIRVLQRLKPAHTIVTVDPRGMPVHRPIKLRRAAADSTYWQIGTKVAPKAKHKDVYARYQQGKAVRQPKPSFSHYQGEAWSYNGDVTSVVSYAETAEGERIKTPNSQRIVDEKRVITYPPDQATLDTTSIMLGRYSSDGVLLTTQRVKR